LIGWPRGTLAQFAYLGAVALGFALVVFVVLGFRYDWDFPVNPYRARYFYDGSTVHATGWDVCGVGDVDGDGCADLAVTSLFDPETEACHDSSWIMSGRTGAGIVRLAVDPGPRGCTWLGTVTGCCEIAVDPIDPSLGEPSANLALTSMGDSGQRGAVYLLSIRSRGVRSILRGRAEGDDFGWSFAQVGDLDGDRVRDHVGTSRGLNGLGGAVARAFSGADGKQLWSTLPVSTAPDERSSFDWIEDVCEAGDVDGDDTPDLAMIRRETGSLSLVSGRAGQTLFAIQEQFPSVRGVPNGHLSAPLERIEDRDGDGLEDLLVGAFANPSRILSPRARSWSSLPRPLYRARSAGDVDHDGRGDFIGSERHFWDPEEIVIVSGDDGRILHRFLPEPGFRFLSSWRLVGDQNADGAGDFALISDNELPSGWGTYSWSPGFGAVTVYSGKDGSVLRRIDRETLVAAARAGIVEWIVK
jgi:hypothetical protein